MDDAGQKSFDLAELSSPAPHHGAGHRSRLRDRLLQGGPDALLDHELIEYLLALALRRGDTKPLAKELLTRFGGIGPLLNADPESLASVNGMGDSTVAAIKIVEAATLRMLRGQILDRPVLSNWQALTDYLRADMAHRLNERVRVLHLDSKNQLIRDEKVSEGSISESAIYVREVIRRALDFGAAAIIVVHNHPSGDPSPSRQDIAITRDLAETAKRLDISLHDHIIIARTGFTSLRSQGLL